MFARSVSLHLRARTLLDFTQILEKELVPMLRQQRGFQDEIAFVIPGGSDVIAISLWDTRENAEAYSTSTYPKILRKLGSIIDQPPVVRTAEVVQSTFHGITTSAAA